MAPLSYESSDIRTVLSLFIRMPAQRARVRARAATAAQDVFAVGAGGFSHAASFVYGSVYCRVRDRGSVAHLHRHGPQS